MIKSLIFQLPCSVLKQARTFSLSRTLGIKEIVETKTDRKLEIEGRIVEAPWKHLLIPSTVKSKQSCETCSVCSSNLNIQHTDVLILKQFLRSDGCILPRRITGLCRYQQKRIGTMVLMAQRAGLMDTLTPTFIIRDLKRIRLFKKNTYFDESTIRLPRECRTKNIQLYKLV